MNLQPLKDKVAIKDLSIQFEGALRMLKEGGHGDAPPCNGNCRACAVVYQGYALLEQVGGDCPDAVLASDRLVREWKRIISRADLTLGQCECDGTPDCFHCEKRLPKTTPIEVFSRYIVARCPRCGCMTPFRRARKKHARRTA